MPQTLRPAERLSEKDGPGVQSLTYFQPPYLASIKETSPLDQSFSSSSNINLHRTPAVRRLSNPDSFSLYNTPEDSSHTVITASSPSSYSGPDLLRALRMGSKDYELEEDEDFYMENTTASTATATHAQYYGHPTTTNSDASLASFYYNNSPIQTTVQRHHPAQLVSYLSGPSAFYAGPVRGAEYYSIKTADNSNQQGGGQF